MAISIDSSGEKVVKPYVEENHLTFPHLIDQANEVSRVFMVPATPTTFLLDREGRLVGGGAGYRDWGAPEAHQLIEALLEGGS